MDSLVILEELLSLTQEFKKWEPILNKQYQILK